MRHLVLSLIAFILVLLPLKADSPSGVQIPVGQTLKNVEFPYYQEGVLKYKLSVTEATGITQNRADTTNLKILVYDAKGNVSTTITSPRADLLVSDQKMRTKNTVLIVQADKEISAQSCDFDLRNKKYLLRTNVKVILKNFDAGQSGKTAPLVPTPTADATPAPAPLPQHAPGASIMDTPGSYSDTNAPPLPQPAPDYK